MSESIQVSKDELAIVIYDAPMPPKYFRLTKKFIRRLFFVFPLLMILIGTILVFWGLGVRLQDAPAPKFTKQLSKPADDKITTLEAEIKTLKTSNDELANKLASTPNATTNADEPFLLNLKKPYGMQNLIASNLVTLDQFEFVTGAKTSLKFQIISTVPERKVSGHVLVFMASQDGLMVYPADANINLAQGVKYSEGEPFAVSRLRPTNAEFNHKLTDRNVKFIIYIFSREGDLLLVKETDSFKVESRQ